MRKPVNFIIKALDAFMEYHGIKKGEEFTLLYRDGENAGKFYCTARVSPMYMISFGNEGWRNDRVDQLLCGKYDVVVKGAKEEPRVRGFELVEGKEGARFPERATKHSAGYDFFAREDMEILPHTVAIAWTGVKAYMPADEVLKMYNRSSNAKKKGIMLSNGVGVVDSDYYNNPDNEGDIGFAFYNFTDDIVAIKKGEKLGQGIFEKYAVADNDICGGERTGGFGSTGK